ncbi:MAG TPA: hypothetical protein VNA88_15735 [Candidatus Kapabacteria bacterium]|nr:hypothetical protein [Candidatus Kapabacteria bacterium]
MRRFYTLALLLVLLADVASAQVPWTFRVRDWSTGQYKDVTATLLFEGRFARVWVDDVDTARAAVKAALPNLVRALDTAIAGTNMNIVPRDPNKGILQNDIEVFGDVPSIVTVEGKTDFLMTNLGSGILGYFSPTDQLAKTVDGNSNEMNLLYINSRQGVSNLTQLLSTIAHEFQHLIHHSRYPRAGSNDRSHSFFNEGLSENANLVNGYFDRINTGYLANTNIDLFTMRSDPPSAQDLDYQRAMTFVHYLREQFGERFLYEFTGMREEGMTRITKTLETIGITGVTGVDVLENFAVANLLQISTNPAHGYRHRLGTLNTSATNPPRATVHENYTGTSFPATQNIVLQAHGIYYIRYNTPGPMQVRLGGSGDGRAIMIGVRNGQTEVVELQGETDYTLPLWAGGPFERVTIAIVNAGSGVRDVTWSAQALTSGVETDAAIAFGIVGASIDAGASVASVRSTLASADAARLELYNLRGERVRTHELEPVAGAQTVYLDVAELPAGGYVARLVQGGRSVTSGLLLAR